MLHRKIWVKRPGASATLVQVREDDLVDDVRDVILKKYGNSLGRSFDAPDIILRIVPRAEHGQKQVERVLGPDEQMCQTLDKEYPGGQAVDEALIIDIPQRRTPKPSPRGMNPYMHSYLEEAARPVENGGDYFPPMPAASPAITAASHHSNHSSNEHTRAMSVLNTGQVPPLPSPGGTRRAHHKNSNRPAYMRQHTSSPTTLQAPPTGSSQKVVRPRLDSNASDHRHSAILVGNPPISTPPAQTHDGAAIAPTSTLVNTSHPSSPRVSSPGPRKPKARKNKPPAENTMLAPSIPTSLGLDTSVPPINVLIVEDNHINLKLLEQFIRRLKVRWATAVNGREAVNKWRAGGFHLVLMDIQLPIMSGLEATKEIRRLERVNGIGVFSGSSASSEAPKLLARKSQSIEEAKEEDKLDVERLFKSPVIIVALTASNLQVDRHEALAAGCNDFLTKPVNFVWFERKVKEWGCMQALIDFDGWHKWKDFASAQSPVNSKTANGTKDKKPVKEVVSVKKPAASKPPLPTEDSADLSGTPGPDAESSSN
ncbi:hypothetical protein NA57DRAFT_29683 [Rhizodiscina lignyota]|uniref:Response regulatory domain-containing protein n=1 Tax=Rhizodiscina lignyota TaxID=1504668 RepID=A0A9P4ISM7_9PEZI|nr:hypothetical protein NA57DRAFT_29683 [Rhizodiscina lignyota]